MHGKTHRFCHFFFFFFWKKKEEKSVGVGVGLGGKRVVMVQTFILFCAFFSGASEVPSLFVEFFHLGHSLLNDAFSFFWVILGDLILLLCFGEDVDGLTPSFFHRIGLYHLVLSGGFDNPAENQCPASADER